MSELIDSAGVRLNVSPSSSPPPFAFQLTQLTRDFLQTTKGRHDTNIETNIERRDNKERETGRVGSKVTTWVCMRHEPNCLADSVWLSGGFDQRGAIEAGELPRADMLLRMIVSMLDAYGWRFTRC